MKFPNFKEEKKLWKKYRLVAGLDEAGRGPLAGPVVASALAVIGNKEIPKIAKAFHGLKDSKQLTENQREKFYKLLTCHPKIIWGVGQVSEKIIDRINILEATKLAMKKAAEGLERKLKGKNKKEPSNHVVPKSHDREILVRQGLRLSYLVLDGNFKINMDIPQKPVIKGDQKVFSCAAASVLAKVTRDRIMKKYHQKYPKYGFLKHKGYPTKYHRLMIEKYGPCLIHRKSFQLLER